jgi:hypothetical protein
VPIPKRSEDPASEHPTPDPRSSLRMSRFYPSEMARRFLAIEQIWAPETFSRTSCKTAGTAPGMPKYGRARFKIIP